MKIVVLLMFLAIQIGPIDTNNLIGKTWVNKSENTRFPYMIGDKVEFIPYSSPEAQQVSMSYRYNGITFFDNGVFRQKHWKKCGNDNGPMYSEGDWEVNESKNVLFISGIDNWEGEYNILELTEKSMVLKRIK